MSFLDSIRNTLWGTGKSNTDNSTAQWISAITAIQKQQQQNSINATNQSTTSQEAAAKKDYGVREQVDPDTNYSIPVVYGDSFLGGSVTDAALTDDNKTMWYCFTLSELTGVKLSDNVQSVISFKEVYWNGMRVTFQSDGVTVDKLYDDEKNEIANFSGLIKFYPFSGNSNQPVSFATQSVGNSTAAYSLFPQWTATDTMTNLVFCLVKVTYNAEKGCTGVGNLRFKLSNTMKQPGDVMYDYMTNTRYGAGIPQEEIKST